MQRRWDERELSETVERVKRVLESWRFPKVFVYDVPKQFTSELAKRYGRCERDQYGTEIWFHRNFRDDKNGVRMMNPDEVDLFFVPQYGASYGRERCLRHESRASHGRNERVFFGSFVARKVNGRILTERMGETTFSSLPEREDRRFSRLAKGNTALNLFNAGRRSDVTAI